MRWKTVWSKNPFLARLTNEAVAFGEVFVASLIVKVPQFVRNVTSYVFDGTSRAVGRASRLRLGVGVLTGTQPFASGVVDADFDPPPHAARSRASTATAGSRKSLLKTGITSSRRAPRRPA